MDLNNIDFMEIERILGKEVEPEDFIPPATTDSIFKFLFGTEENKEFLAELLSAILGLEREKFENLTFKNTELQGDSLDDKKSILDIRVKMNSGEEIDVEIQRFYSADLLDRFLYYWARMFTKQMKIGQKYKDLKKCICINLLDFKIEDEADCHLTYHIYDDKHKKLFSDLFEIHLLELPKVEELKDLNKTLYNWLRLIQLTSRKEMKTMTKSSPMLEKAIKKLESFNQDEDAYLSAVKEYFYYYDEANHVDEARKDAKEKGREEGRAEGRAEGREEGERIKALEIAKNLKEKKVDIETIILSTGLSKEEVEGL